jgi:hypothetical protein
VGIRTYKECIQWAIQPLISSLERLGGDLIGKMSRAAKSGRVEHEQNTGNERSGIIQDLIFDLNLEFGLLITNFFLRSLPVNLPQYLSGLKQVSSSQQMISWS